MPDRSSRRWILRAGFAGLAGVLAGCQSPRVGDSPGEDGDVEGTDGDGASTPTGTGTETSGLPDALAAEPIATGLTAPVDIAFPPTEGVDAYVLDQIGQIHVLEDDGLRTERFLDVTAQLVELGGYEERGLLGVALHPQYDENGRLFVRYSGSDSPSGFSHTFVLSEFEAAGDRLAVDPASERRLLEIPQPQPNHNAGPIAFGPEGYLYVAVGDGGGAGDRGSGHATDWYESNAGGNGQDVTENRLGSILRIDVDAETDGNPYGIPPDNPLVGDEGFPEHYAWGFRNPWGMSFAGSEFFVADVGQNRFEEVNLVEKGGNYGWNVREGTHCFSTETPSQPPESCPTETPTGSPLIDPIIEYSHDDPIGGVAVVGGYLYEGEAIPGLQGAYVFADWRAEGTLYVATRPDGDGRWPITPIPVTGPRSPGDLLLGFGRDRVAELYLLSTDRPTVSGQTGTVHRLVPGSG